jgi:hypothetical protein
VSKSAAFSIYLAFKRAAVWAVSAAINALFVAILHLVFAARYCAAHDSVAFHAAQSAQTVKVCDALLVNFALGAASSAINVSFIIVLSVVTAALDNLADVAYALLPFCAVSISPASLAAAWTASAAVNTFFIAVAPVVIAAWRCALQHAINIGTVSISFTIIINFAFFS